MGYAFFERVRGAKKDKNAKRWIKDSWLNSKPPLNHIQHI
jgi:hypothetical protein